METQESNKLIAEFMDIPIVEHDGIWYNPEDTSMKFDYDTSWDRLMPVGKRCMNIAYGLDDGYWHELLMDAAITYKKEPIYQAVIEFIKYYNNQNK